MHVAHTRCLDWEPLLRLGPLFRYKLLCPPRHSSDEGPFFREGPRATTWLGEPLPADCLGNNTPAAIVVGGPRAADQRGDCSAQSRYYCVMSRPGPQWGAPAPQPRCYPSRLEGTPGARQRSRADPVDRAPEDPLGAGLLDRGGRKRVVGSLDDGGGEICPLQTPMLHSLSRERACPPETGHKDMAAAPSEALAGKPLRRSDRFALQCSFLENPRDGGAWWAAVYGVSQSRTQLK